MPTESADRDGLRHDTNPAAERPASNPSDAKPTFWIVTFCMESSSPRSLLADLAQLGLTETGIAVNQYGKVVAWNGSVGQRKYGRVRAARALRKAASYIKTGKVVRLPNPYTREWFKE